MVKVVIALVLTLAATGSALGQTLDDIVRDVEASYARMTDLRAEFTQSAFNKSLNQTIPAKGTVYLKRGGKLRWEYTEPTAQEIVSDGKKLWVYTPTLNQANVGDAPAALAGPAGSFLAGLGRLRAEFTVRFLNPAQPKDAEGNWVLDRDALRRHEGERPLRQKISLQQGIPIERAREIVRLIKDTKIRVQASIQEDQVRVAGKNRDDLQKIIAMLRDKDLGIAIQFTNYRNT